MTRWWQFIVKQSCLPNCFYRILTAEPQGLHSFSVRVDTQGSILVSTVFIVYWYLGEMSEVSGVKIGGEEREEAFKLDKG